MEAVALPVAEYEQLLASRRQMGGQSARIRTLSEKLRRTEQLLDDLEGLVAAPEPVRGTPLDAGDCSEAGRADVPEGTEAAKDEAAALRRAVAELLRRHRGTSS
ncbi:hypothetical protein [Streptomyces sp. NPDC127039]|uniref:hypothetical protein n=1 Tax=Streptomyces sp. NPDC127039 TaxID=3347115 RepID=UPI00364BBC9B